ncbi:cupin domain-containing protein [Nitrospinota bacterium]
MLVYVEREADTSQEHTHENEQLVYLLKGKARFTVNGESHEAEAGHVVHIPAGVPHGVEAHTPITYLGVYTPLPARRPLLFGLPPTLGPQFLHRFEHTSDPVGQHLRAARVHAHHQRLADLFGP